MNVSCWVIGKTHPAYLEEGTSIFEKRLKRYFPFSIETIPDIRKGGKLPPKQLKEREGEAVLARLSPQDYLILLDENGKTYTSNRFSKVLERLLQRSNRRLIFLIGGAYGVSDALFERADEQLALSKMTFSHQMIRLFLLEQLYRGMSILHNEPYHND